MLAYKINSNKSFANHLFISDTFDRFVLSEAVFNIPYTVSIDGTYQTDEGTGFAAWGRLRPLCAQIVKAKEDPFSFRLVLKLSEENLNRTIASIGSDIHADCVSGLYINIRFEKDTFSFTNGSSVSDIRQMQRINEGWDRMLLQFFLSRGIELTEL